MKIPYGKQNITNADIDAVIEVLKSPLITQGPTVPKFEQSICDYVGCKYGVAVSSATAALHIAVKALGLCNDGILWTSPITFVASANCGLYCGAEIDFVDIDPETYNMCPKALENKLIVAEKTGKLPSVVVVVHMAGQSADMRSIHALSRKYNFKIIEDASHAIGGSFVDDKVGSCRFSDVTVFSFHPVKIITTGEGGAAVTNCEVLASKMRQLRTHGITRDPKDWSLQKQGEWYYEMADLGYNYRLTDLQAALGLSQMEQLSENIQKRNDLAQRYEILLNKDKLKLPFVSDEVYSAYHLYIVKLPDKASRLLIFNDLREKGIGVNVHYIPIHLQPYYSDMGFRTGDFPKAEEYYERALTIPLYPNLSFCEQDYVAENLNKALQRWT